MRPSELDVYIQPLVGQAFICIWIGAWCPDRLPNISQTTQLLIRLVHSLNPLLVPKEMDQWYPFEADCWDEIPPWYGEEDDIEVGPKICVPTPVFSNIYYIIMFQTVPEQQHFRHDRPGPVDLPWRNPASIQRRLLPLFCASTWLHGLWCGEWTSSGNDEPLIWIRFSPISFQVLSGVCVQTALHVVIILEKND